MCGSKTSSQQNSSQQTYATPQASAAYNTVLGKATAAANTPYQAYTGELTAGFNGQEQGATTALNGLGTAVNGYFNNAATQSGLGAAAVNPTALGAAAIQQYENPYQSSVIAATQAQIAQQDAIQQQQTSNAIGAGAYGGDRAGIAQAALAGQQALANNATLAGLNQANYNQALGAAQQQQGLGLAAAQANRAAVQQNASTLAGLGTASASSGLGIANAQLGAGALQQQTQQAADTAQYGQFEQAQAFPFQEAQYLAGIVDSTAPLYGSTSTGQQTTQTNPLNSILGGVLGLGAKLSDVEAKENIRHVGKMFDGQNLYVYNYRGDDPRNVQLGLMAQEVEHHHPHAVHPLHQGLGAFKFVDYAAATRAAAEKGHFATGGSVGLGGNVLSSLQSMADVGAEDRARASHTISLAAERERHRREASTALGRAVHHMEVDPRLAVGLGRAGYANGGATSSLYGQANVMPYAGDGGYVPGVSIQAAKAPTAPNLFGGNSSGQQSNGYDTLGQGLAAAGKTFAGSSYGQELAQSAENGLGNAILGSSSNSYGLPFQRGGDVGLGRAHLPQLRARGGGLAGNRPGYDAGGTIGTDGLLFDPAALNAGPPPANDDAPAASPAPAATLGLGAAAAAAPPPSGGLAGNGLRAIDSAAPQSSTPLGGFGFDASVGRTLSFEGGMNGADTNGTPTNYGINQAAHPEVDVSKITPDQAKAIYRHDYWDGIGADKLPPALAHVAFDTAVVAEPARAKAMLAQSGGDPAKFMDLRDGYLQGLVQSDPGRYGKYAASWANRSAGLRSDIGAGGVPASALGYADGSSPGLGAAGTGSRSVTPGGLGGDGSGQIPVSSLGLGAARLSDVFSPTIGGTGQSRSGYSGGLLGLFPGVSDAGLADLSAMGRAMAASPSKSFGVALGQGILAGTKANQAQQALQRQAADVQSEIGNRTALQGIERSKVSIAQGELDARLKEITGQLGNFASEDQYRKGQIGAENLRIALERYETYPQPDGTIKYIDKANPGRGLISGDQIPEFAAARGAGAPAASSPGGTPAGGGTTPGAPGGSPTPTVPPAAPGTPHDGPLSLTSDSFVRTGQPTLTAPSTYRPTNYTVNQVRMRNDPVVREANAVRSKDDILNSGTAASKAASSLYTADEMDRQIAELSKSGPLQPGAAFPERLDLAKTYNLAAGAIGLPTVDEGAVRAGEAVVKDQRRMGASLTAEDEAGGEAGGSWSDPSCEGPTSDLGLRLFIDDHASIIVPSTLK